MITVHRDYILVYGKGRNHAHIQVNPVGHLDVKIKGRKECLHCEFDDISFQETDSNTKVIGHEEGRRPWQLTLSNRDAAELTHLIQEANEEFEVLMRDL
jgi:hypothetical protein